MNWADFKSSVRNRLHLFNRMHGVQSLIDSNIRVAVMDLMSSEKLLRKRTTKIGNSNTVASGFCGRVTLPSLTHVGNVYVRSNEDATDIKKFSWVGLDALPLMHAGTLPASVPLAAYDPAKGFLYLYPNPSDMAGELVVTYSSVSATFSDTDEVVFDERVAAVVAEYVMGQLSLNVSRDAGAAQMHLQLHARAKRSFIGDMVEARISGVDTPDDGELQSIAAIAEIASMNFSVRPDVQTIAALQAVVTRDLPIPYIIRILIGGSDMQDFVLLSNGAVAPDGVTVVRPADFHATTNPKQWFRKSA